MGPLNRLRVCVFVWGRGVLTSQVRSVSYMIGGVRFTEHFVLRILLKSVSSCNINTAFLFSHSLIHSIVHTLIQPLSHSAVHLTHSFNHSLTYLSVHSLAVEFSIFFSVVRSVTCLWVRAMKWTVGIRLSTVVQRSRQVNTLQLSGNCIYHLLQQSVTLHYVHTVYLCVSYDSHNKQRLFP
jgi:hypothetical protein